LRRRKKTLFKLGIDHPSKLELHTETKARLESAPTDLRSTRQRQRSGGGSVLAGTRRAVAWAEGRGEGAAGGVAYSGVCVEWEEDCSHTLTLHLLPLPH
jgi:hypothetical protein